jgi:hypothetical protein
MRRRRLVASSQLQLRHDVYCTTTRSDVYVYSPQGIKRIGGKNVGRLHAALQPYLLEGISFGQILEGLDDKTREGVFRYINCLSDAGALRMTSSNERCACDVPAALDVVGPGQQLELANLLVQVHLGIVKGSRAVVLLEPDTDLSPSARKLLTERSTDNHLRLYRANGDNCRQLASFKVFTRRGLISTFLQAGVLQVPHVRQLPVYVVEDRSIAPTQVWCAVDWESLVDSIIQSAITRLGGRTVLATMQQKKASTLTRSLNYLSALLPGNSCLALSDAANLGTTTVYGASCTSDHEAVVEPILKGILQHYYPTLATSQTIWVL